MFLREQENTAIMEETFSTRAVRELLGFSRRELLLLEVRRRGQGPRGRETSAVGNRYQVTAVKA
jgi:hypothetical protein